MSSEQRPEPSGSASQGAKSAAGIARNIQTISRLERDAAARRSRFVRVCDVVTRGVGTPTSLAVHVVWFAVWVFWNFGWLGLRPFDPFPFSTLISIVSLEAIFLTLFVLASQNQMTRDADQRANLELQVNMLAEQEMTLVLRMLRDLCSQFNVKTATEDQILSELASDTDINDVADRVQRSMR